MNTAMGPRNQEAWAKNTGASMAFIHSATPQMIRGIAAGTMEKIQAYFFLSIHFCSSAVRWCS